MGDSYPSDVSVSVSVARSEGSRHGIADEGAASPRSSGSSPPPPRRAATKRRRRRHSRSRSRSSSRSSGSSSAKGRRRHHRRRRHRRRSRSRSRSRCRRTPRSRNRGRHNGNGPPPATPPSTATKRQHTRWGNLSSQCTTSVLTPRGASPIPIPSPSSPSSPSRPSAARIITGGVEAEAEAEEEEVGEHSTWKEQEGGRKKKRRKRRRKKQRHSRGGSSKPPAAAAATAAAPVPPSMSSGPWPQPLVVRPYNEARARLLNTLSLLSFGHVTFVRHQQTRRDDLSGKEFCTQYFGFARPIAFSFNGSTNTRVGDKRLTNDTFFNSASRSKRGFAIGPVILLDSHQQSAGECGSDDVDTLPQATRSRREGANDIIFGIKKANEKKTSSADYQMVWWQSNGDKLLAFLHVLQGGSKVVISRLRQLMRSHAGCVDGLFAIFWLVVIGDVQFFVRQYLGTLTTDLPIQALDLGSEENALTFAVQVARSLQCDAMERDIVAAASAAGIAEADYMPAAVVDVFMVEAHPTWEPVTDRTTNPLRRGRPAHELFGEYEAAVDPLTEKAVLHAGFMRAYAERKAAERERPPTEVRPAFDGEHLYSYEQYDCGVPPPLPYHHNNAASHSAAYSPAQTQTSSIARARRMEQLLAAAAGPPASPSSPVKSPGYCPSPPTPPTPPPPPAPTTPQRRPRQPLSAAYDAVPPSPSFPPLPRSPQWGGGEPGEPGEVMVTARSTTAWEEEGATAAAGDGDGDEEPDGPPPPVSTAMA